MAGKSARLSSTELFLLVAVLLGGGVGVYKMTEPRGFRNNNPGNIRKSSIVWNGEDNSGKRTDSAFEVFIDAPSGFPRMGYGLRAMYRLLTNYINGGHDTIRKIVTRYAPSNENDTANYIDYVSRNSGFGPDQVLWTDSDPAVSAVPVIMVDMIKMENGRAVSYDDIVKSATL